MTSDHVAITPDVASRYPAPFYEPLTMLGWLAGVTPQARARHHGYHRPLPPPARDGASDGGG